MLYDALREIAQWYPDHTALKDDDGELTYEQLWNRSLRICRTLQQSGIKPGDRVCLLSENSIDAVLLFWAIVSADAICVYLNEQTPLDGLHQIVDDADPALIVAAAKLAKSKLSVNSDVPFSCKVIEMEALSKSDDGVLEFAPNAKTSGSNPDNIVTIVYTSGSTGKPKGVSLTHTNLISVAKMAGDGYATVPTDRYLMVVPLHYVHGLMILMTMHLRGASIQFMNSFVFPKLVTQKIQSSKVTGFSGVPYHFTALIERGGFLEAALPALRWIGITGGQFTAERLNQIRIAQPQLEIHISYGQTECSPRITALHPDKIDTKADSVGCAAKGLTIEFLDEAGSTVKPLELGELVVSGPTVMHGYWNDPENTRRVIDAKGRLHTGDLAYIDEEGDVFIKGRVQAMIKSAGERIFPEELEKILSASGLVEDVAVVGVPDSLYGQRVEAHVVLKNDSGQSLDALKSYCLDKVAFARSPKHYHRWQAFPLKANGKTDRQKLIGKRSADV